MEREVCRDYRHISFFILPMGYLTIIYITHKIYNNLENIVGFVSCLLIGLHINWLDKLASGCISLFFGLVCGLIIDIAKRSGIMDKVIVWIKNKLNK